MCQSKPNHSSIIARLAELAVHVGLNVQKRQQLVISAPLEAVPLVREITARAYRAGAGLVSCFYTDDVTTLSRYQNADAETFDIAAGWMGSAMAQAFDEGAARLAITGANPTLLSGQNPDFIARASRSASFASRAAMEKITQFATNWSIVAYACPAWARHVFPDLAQEDAVDLLWGAIERASRADQIDPVAAWQEHNRSLSAKAEMLNLRQYAELHFTGPGTDLHVGLADNHFWAGGAEATQSGVICNPNIPSEEVFTTPHCRKVDGVVSSTKPLFHQGSKIDGIRVRFEAGRIVEGRADVGNENFQNLLDTDEGARRLGEVALVAHSSPISQSGLLFHNTLFDENAASHLAIGQAYTKCMQNSQLASPDELAQRGVNTSMVHVDWMIGSGEIDVDGVTKEGTNIPLMRKGEWVA